MTIGTVRDTGARMPAAPMLNAELSATSIALTKTR